MPDHYRAMLDMAIQEAKTGLAEGGIPIGTALFHKSGTLLGRGHNRRIQDNDPSCRLHYSLANHFNGLSLDSACGLKSKRLR